MCGCKSSYDGKPCECKKIKEDSLSFDGGKVKNFIIEYKWYIIIIVLVAGVLLYRYFIKNK